MTDNIKSKFGGFKDKFKLPTRKKISNELGDVVPEAVDETPNGSTISSKEKYKQLLNNIVINGLLNIAEDKLNDDVFIESVFNKAYELLPTPIRLVVKREWCLNYLQTQKVPLLEKLKDYRVNPTTETEILPIESLPSPIQEKNVNQR
ncbi:hypothetical protein [Klebsiella quasipneumoniae]|uniref:hypothetical protein n=1 Tax=Klebsiella quasipneumoniae TaxID=1463165 RepID=UPI00092F8354|nr:hypothetical protein [Klebsiella quasipneumoniae]HBW1466653.1 hypothetical protein [Klebsiella pneumoniae]